MAHSRAKLTPFGRLLLVERVAALGWTVAAASEALGVSGATGHKWVRRYRQEGLGGLTDRSSRPRRCPHRLSASAERRILRGRRRLRCGLHSLGPRLGHPRSTVYKVLRRNGVSRLRDQDRPSGVPVRYTREHPGELLHLDVKKLARIPDGGGHRIHGRERGRAGQPRGSGTTCTSLWTTARGLPTAVSVRTNAAPRQPGSCSQQRCFSTPMASASSVCLLTAP